MDPDIKDTSDDLKGDVPYLGRIRVLVRIRPDLEQWGEVNFRMRGLYVKFQDGHTIPFDVRNVQRAEINDVMFARTD